MAEQKKEKKPEKKVKVQKATKSAGASMLEVLMSWGVVIGICALAVGCIGVMVVTMNDTGRPWVPAIAVAIAIVLTCGLIPLSPHLKDPGSAH